MPPVEGSLNSATPPYGVGAIDLGAAIGGSLTVSSER